MVIGFAASTSLTDVPDIQAFVSIVFMASISMVTVFVASISMVFAASRIACRNMAFSEANTEGADGLPTLPSDGLDAPGLDC